MHDIMLIAFVIAEHQKPLLLRALVQIDPDWLSIVSRMYCFSNFHIKYSNVEGTD